MEQSATITNLAKALLAFQVKVETIHTDSVNPHFRNKYASLTQILQAIKDPLADCGLVITQFPSGENELVTTILHADSGEYMRSTYTMKPERDSPQGKGSVISYQRRYCIQAALNLCFEDDDDANAASAKQPAQTNGATQPTEAPAGIPKKTYSNYPEPTHWLDEGTDMYQKAVAKLKSGETTIPKIRQAFKVSKKVEAALLADAGIKAEPKKK